MTTHGSVAKRVRLDKEQHPERYCAIPRCLWRTDDMYCPRHVRPGSVPVALHEAMTERAEQSAAHTALSGVRPSAGSTEEA